MAEHQNDGVSSTLRILDVTDPTSLRALAHPTRVRLLRLVRTHQPVTGAELAPMIGESTASVSYHLSVLARHGFIEPDPTPGATRRHKPWRQTFDELRIDSTATRYGSGDTAPGDGVGGAVLSTLLSETRGEQDAYLRTPVDPEQAVADAATFQLSQLVLTVEAAGELSAAVAEVVDRYRSDRSPGPDEARFSVTFIAVPLSEEVAR